MDRSEYMGMFLAETREHLDTLNLAVVRIEQAPDDRETLDEIFRTAHSLKGMSATMGFERIASLTHKMEDVFEVLRSRPGGVGREAIDVLLECLDALLGAVDSIAAEGAEMLDPARLIGRLETLVGDSGAAPDAPRTAERAAPQASDSGMLHIRAELSADALMPSVRAYMVLASAGDFGVVTSSTPAEDAVDGFAGAVVDVWLASEHDAADVRTAIAGVPDVASVTVDEHAQSATASPPRREARRTGATVRVDAERLDQLMHLMGELVVGRTAVEGLAGQAQVPGLAEAVQDLTRSSQALQALIMQVRMIPVDAVLMRLPRLVRDLAAKLDKQVDLVLTGRETELDRTVVDMLGDPLVHLVRNAVDHALETPEERRAAGKPAAGRLEIAARHAGGNVVITVTDDGRGIDPAKIARRAVERGLIDRSHVPAVDMAEAVDLLFEPGFSTAETTSDISGRGVGMDAVRSAIRELGGAVTLQSERGCGTTVQVRLPLTLAILPSLLVRSGGSPFALPLDRVERTLNLTEQVVRSVTGCPVLVLADGVLPLLPLSESLGYAGADDADYAVVVRGNGDRVALAVDQLVGQRELVTRPLPQHVGSDIALSGGAVLPDGSIALIVDCDALAALPGRVAATPLPNAA
jgi:two-component system chemotaxis sensor kinase CheA